MIAEISKSNPRAALFLTAPSHVNWNVTYRPPSVCTDLNRISRRRGFRQMCMESTQLETPIVPNTAEAIVRDIWNKCSDAKFTLWLPYFDESAVYHDTLYPSPFVGKSAIASHLKSMESAIPPEIVFVLDDVAAGSDRVGARWHAQTGDGTQIPFSRGASMYSFVRRNGRLLITEAWDFPETPLKLAGVILPLLRSASAILRFFDTKGKSS